MTTLPEISHRLAVAAELQSVVRTMKMISAVGIRHHESAEEASRRYLGTIEAAIQVALRATTKSKLPPPPLSTGPAAIAIIGTEIGLCGSLNDQLISFALEALSKAGLDPRRQRVVTIGARADAGWRSRVGTPSAHEAAPETLDAIPLKAGAVLTRLEQWQREDGITHLTLFHHQPAGRGLSTPVETQLLPLDNEWLATLRARPWPSRQLPVTGEPAERLLQRLVRQLLYARTFTAIVQARTAEFAVRLATMQGADRNIAEKIEDLQSTHRLARQDLITSELLDLVAGYEAVIAQADSPSGTPE